MFNAVLSVEDNDIHAYALKRSLTNMGYSVTVAGCGQAAVDMAGGRQFDAVLLDLCLPDIDGFAVCDLIRRLPEGKKPAIIFYSANVGSTATLQRVADLCADGFLTYPIDAEHLDAVLRGCIAKRRFLNE
jgi:CheY-like chemotaxis protein